MMAGRLHSPVGLDRRRGGGAAPCLHVAAAAAVMPWLCFDRHKNPLGTRFTKRQHRRASRFTPPVLTYNYMLFVPFLIGQTLDTF